MASNEFPIGIRLTIARSRPREYSAFGFINLIDRAGYALERITKQKVLQLWDVHPGPGQTGITVYADKFLPEVSQELIKKCGDKTWYAAQFPAGILTRYEDLQNLVECAPTHRVQGGIATLETLGHHSLHVISNDGTPYTYVDLLAHCNGGALSVSGFGSWIQEGKNLAADLQPWDAMTLELMLNSGKKRLLPVYAGADQSPPKPCQ